MKKKPIMVLLHIIMVFYIVFVIWSFSEYHTYVASTIAKYEALGIFPPGEAGKWVDPHFYGHFWYAKAVGLIGVALTVSWIVVASIDQEVKACPT